MRAIATVGVPSDAEHVTRNFHADLSRIEEQGATEVTLAGRRFTIQQQFLKGREVRGCGGASPRLIIL